MMKCYKIALYSIISTLCFVNNFPGYGADNADQSETKRIDMPFINIGVKKHSDGTKDVDVKAPFVKVHNPAGDNNAQVNAPFTKVENGRQIPSNQSAVPSKTKVETYSTVTKTK